MGRDWGPAYKFFELQKEGSNGKLDCFKCRFCGAQYQRNHTKMLRHLQKQCKLVSNLAKQQLSGVPEELNNPSSPVSPAAQSHDGARSQNLQGTRPILEGFLDSITANEQGHLKHLLARAIFSSASPCSIFETEDWKNFFKRLRPSFKLPGRKKVSNNLLDDEYARMKSQVTSSINNSKNITIQCDSWTNIRSEGVTNIIISTPTPYLYESIQSGSSSQDGEYYCEKISNAIEEVGPDKVIAYVTDNASVMKKSWRMLQKKYPHLIAFGCSAHGLNLLCKDIMKLPRLLKMEKFVNSLVTVMKKSSLLTGRLKELQQGRNLELKLSNNTRWISTLMSFTSVTRCKSSIRQIGVDPLYEKTLGLDRVTKILSSQFWDELIQVTEIMKPIAKWIVLLQTEKKPMMHLVYPAFQEIKAMISEYFKKCDLNAGEKKKILAAIKRRQTFCVQPVHLAAHLLDPSAQGIQLSSSSTHAALNFIFNWTQKLPHVDTVKVMTELANFRAKTDVFHNGSFLWAMKTPAMSTVQWWSLVSGTSSLSDVAIGLLNICPTTATTERSFSTFKIVQSAKRNRLANDRAGKLVYLCHNIRLDSARDLSRIDESLHNIGLDGKSLLTTNGSMPEVIMSRTSDAIEDIMEVDSPTDNEDYSDVESICEEDNADIVSEGEVTASDGELDVAEDLPPLEDDDEDEIAELFRLATSSDYFNII